MERGGKLTVEGFVFAPDRITGMQDVAGNTREDLKVASGEPTFNFGTDIEFLQALPLTEGYAAHVNFYHPARSIAGSSRPTTIRRAKTSKCGSPKAAS